MGFRIYLGNRRYYAGLSKCHVTGRMSASTMTAADASTLPLVPVLRRPAAVQRLHQMRAAGYSAWLLAAV